MVDELTVKAIPWLQDPYPLGLHHWIYQVALPEARGTLGDRALAAWGTPRAGTVKPIPALHVPYPAGFQVWTHQVALPGARGVEVVQLQVPLTHAQSARSHWRTFPPPVASVTQR
jgi:hypothetical protein